MLDFLKDVLPDTPGYVPIITRDDAGHLKKTQWFQWPSEADHIVEYVEGHSREDVYFSPMLYTKPRTMFSRGHIAKANVTACSVVYADADTAKPEVFALPPTRVVETSPGKYHTYWRLDDTTDPLLCEQLSHAVSITHRDDGVDNGWALSKRLRVPGTTNTKYGEGVPVTALPPGEVYTVGEFAADYEPVESVESSSDIPAEIPSAYDVFNTIEFDAYVHDLFTVTPLSDYSLELFKLQMALFKRGLDVVQVFAVCREAACNKFTRPGRTEEELWKHVLTTKETFDQEQAEEKESEHDIPAAPKPKVTSWETLDLLDPDERASLPRTFIDQYADWGKAQSSRSARQYHEAAAFTILSTVFSEFGHIVPGFGNTPLNLYFLILGLTTRSRKSTSKNLMMRVIDELSKDGSGYDYDLGSDATPEALTAVLSTKPGQSSIFWRDEVQGLFSAVAAGGYLRGLLPMLTNAYDGAVDGVLRKTGDMKRTKETKTNLIFYGMGIVDQVAEVLTDDDFYSGFLPRVLFVIDTETDKQFGATDVVQRDDDHGRKFDEEFMRMVTALTQARSYWSRAKTTRGESWPIRATDEAWARWQAMTVQIEELADRHPTRAAVLSPGAQRLGMSVLKCAALLAMLDKSDEIEMHHMLTAIKYGTEWAKYMEYMARQVSKTVQGRELEELEAFVSAQTKPVPYARALNLFKGRKTVREFNELLDFCVQSGTILVNVSGRTKTLEAR